ncbi:MAG: UDP-N-acetylmuramoyl-L-alanyl-D-glutamate--2,6-diaminopimelate ligase, partial [Ilumatobacteraceae bacterium]
AIAAALAPLNPGDVLVVAGKGHERTQDLGETVVDFDDRAVITELLDDGLPENDVLGGGA